MISASLHRTSTPLSLAQSATRARMAMRVRPMGVGVRGRQSSAALGLQRMRAPRRGFSACAQKVGVLFDFDGTVGDTETPAMEVAYWELAPYFINPKPEEMEGQMKADWIRLNCGKPFGEMADDLDEERKAAGLKSYAEMRKAREEDPKVMEVVNAARARMGLKSIQQIRDEGAEIDDLWDQSRGEFEQALSVLAKPCKNIPELLDYLTEERIPFSIATTSPKPRVPISVDAAGLRKYFPAEKIHSGESDFVPSRFKPDPSVYLKAAEECGVAPENCIAFEDSASGVGSAANAGIGMIIGYVGATHIPLAEKKAHAEMLISGEKSEQGRGADVVIWDMIDAIPLIVGFKERRRQGMEGPHVPNIEPDILNQMESQATINWAPKAPATIAGVEPW
eukprot:CAMPEP_0167789952 /NCGR_PEP_ID=MMETSP0111_2-20121227/11010_1 /TAXON_ID=91324 /ORGANISM="Lotharella globosa, Strain CCCM811" /LENGTH=393 /DNA_ID=CAMNT_0007682255 /DNA_START=104 /DNA_END=1285 /DNA_ORIENTATION=-